MVESLYVIHVFCVFVVFFFFKQKTAYEMRISDWSSDVCSSDLRAALGSAIDLADHIAGGGRAVLAEMRAVKVVHEVLALLQLLRELVDRLAIARDLAGAAGDGLVPGGESGALLLDLSAAGGNGQAESNTADQGGREQADRGKLSPARDLDEL